MHFLCTNNKTSLKIQKTMPFTIAPKTIRYLGINLIKEVKNHTMKNYKTLMKEIKADTNKWKILYVHGFEELIVKMSILAQRRRLPSWSYWWRTRRHKRQGIDPWLGKIPYRRKWQPTLVFLHGEFLHGESHRFCSLEGYSPWGLKESDMTEAT